MDPRILKLGSELTACPYRAECPGIRAGVVTNDPARGVFPRGFLVTPHDARPEDVRLVVLGQNPGAWDEWHRSTMLELTAGKTPEEQFEAINRFFFRNLPTYDYNKRIDMLIAATVGLERAGARLEAEVACCEDCTSAKEDRPSAKVHIATLDFCASKHLVRHLGLLSRSTNVLCVGAVARNWVRRTAFADRFRWFHVPHPTGRWTKADFERGIDLATGRLKPDAQNRWDGFAAGAVNGVSLVPIRRRRRGETQE